MIKLLEKQHRETYSFNYNKNLSFGYINTEHSNDQLLKKNIFIEIEKKKYLAKILLKPLKETKYKKI